MNGKVVSIAVGVLVAASLALGGLGGAASGSSRSPRSVRHGAASVINVCGDLALSGGYTQLGAADNYGAIAFFRYMDRKGGIDGHHVVYSYINNQSSPAEAEAIAKECILQRHANFIVGPESGADTQAAMPIAIAYHVPLISLSSGWTSNGYPAADVHSYAFPGFYDVFYEDDLSTVEDLIVPQHLKRVALIMDNCGLQCLVNQSSMQVLAKRYHFKLVASSTFAFGATNVTANVLSLLAAKPQIIVLGLVPGTDTVTAIKAIRAQDPTIPISECSGCSLPSFIAAAGGAKAMQKVYFIGSMEQWLASAERGTTPAAKTTAAGFKAYFAGMKASNFTTGNEIDNSRGGWQAGLEIAWGVDRAGTTSEPQVMHALQHLNTNTLGIVWDRNPGNYGNITQVFQPMATVEPNGTVAIYKG